MCGTEHSAPGRKRCTGIIAFAFLLCLVPVAVTGCAPPAARMPEPMVADAVLVQEVARRLDALPFWSPDWSVPLSPSQVHDRDARILSGLDDICRFPLNAIGVALSFRIDRAIDAFYGHSDDPMRCCKVFGEPILVARYLFDIPTELGRWPFVRGEDGRFRAVLDVMHDPNDPSQIWTGPSELPSAPPVKSARWFSGQRSRYRRRIECPAETEPTLFRKMLVDEAARKIESLPPWHFVDQGDKGRREAILSALAGLRVYSDATLHDAMRVVIGRAESPGAGPDGEDAYWAWVGNECKKAASRELGRSVRYTNWIHGGARLGQALLRCYLVNKYLFDLPAGRPDTYVSLPGGWYFMRDIGESPVPPPLAWPFEVDARGAVTMSRLAGAPVFIGRSWGEDELLAMFDYYSRTYSRREWREMAEPPPAPPQPYQPYPPGQPPR